MTLSGHGLIRMLFNVPVSISISIINLQGTFVQFRKYSNKEKLK